MGAFMVSVDEEMYKRYGVFILNKKEGEYRYIFRLFYPGAESVELTGDMNMWGKNEMVRVSPSTFEADIVSDVPLDGTCYKYRIKKDGEILVVPDPFSRYLRRDRSVDSIICATDEYNWNDREWHRKRREMGSRLDRPINIYEVDLDCWRRDEDSMRKDGCLGYRELGTAMSSYVSDMGYTHLSIGSVMEADELYKNGIEGYFCPLSRHGRPDELKNMIDTLHASGIAVICELNVRGDISSFFGNDTEQTAKFYRDVVAFWVKEFHIDGFKINVNGMSEDSAECVLSAVNSYIVKQNCGVLSIAGNISAEIVERMKECDAPFDLVLNETLCDSVTELLGSDQETAKYKYGRLGYSLMNALGECSVFSISSGRLTEANLLSQMPGKTEEKFAGLKQLLGYMMLHPGKKLTFMGCEIGETKPFDKKSQLQWHLTEYVSHKDLIEYVKDLNTFYTSSPALWEIDDSWRGFEWYTAGKGEERVMSFARIGADGGRLVALLNFSDCEHVSYRISVGDGMKKYTVIFSTSSDAVGTMLESDVDGNVVCAFPPHSIMILKPL